MTTLFVLGNTNEHTFANAIVAANLTSITEFGSSLREIYVLHTPESHRTLSTSEAWIEHLRANSINSDIIIHRTLEISLNAPADAISKFTRYVETAVRASEPGEVIVDLTNGTATHKTLLSTVAYVLDIPHLYTIDVSRLGKPTRDLGFLDVDILRSAYTRSPDSTALDAIAHLSMTEVVRYRRIIDVHTRRYTDISPSASDEDFFSANLLHSIGMKLQGDRLRPRDNALYRIASSSVAASVEELVRVLMTRLPAREASDSDRFTLGQRLSILSDHVKSHPQPDFDYEFFRRFNDFMLYLRNSTTHKGKLLTDVERFKADLAVKMSFPFLEFYADIVCPLITNPATATCPTRIEVLANAQILQSESYLVGIDGDDTGSILEDLFLSSNDEKRFRELSKNVEKAVAAISRRVRERGGKNAIIFAAGDDILFRGRVDERFLLELQRSYAASTQGLTCSIGYGKSFREVYVAMKLAKSKPGKNSIVGIELQ